MAAPDDLPTTPHQDRHITRIAPTFAGPRPYVAAPPVRRSEPPVGSVGSLTGQVAPRGEVVA